MAASKVIIIEDDDTIRDAVKVVLEDSGYSVETFSDGKIALDTISARNDEPCLILLDMMMPNITGWDFLKLKNKTSGIVSIPVYTMSSVVNSTEEAHKIGAQGYVRKPFDLDNLLAIVKTYCKDCNEG